MQESSGGFSRSPVSAPLAQCTCPCPTEVMRSLKAQPEFRARSEASGQKEGRLRRNAPFAPNDFVHALKRDTELTRKVVLGGSKWSQELLQKNHPGAWERDR
jgi:hypothetical protein